MGFWEDQVEELVRCVDVLIGADNAPATPGEAPHLGGRPGLSEMASADISVSQNWQGAAAATASDAARKLAADAAAAAEADRAVSEALQRAHAHAAEVCDSLKGIRDGIEAGFAIRREHLGLPAVEAELATFLCERAREIVAVARQAQHDSAEHIERLAAASGYSQGLTPGN